MNGLIQAQVVVTKGEFMTSGMMKMFIWEITRQADFGLTAASDFRASLDSGDLNRFWYSIQAFLVATANVSKLLWPKDSLARGEALLAELQIVDGSPLASKRARNQFEHFDEKLEKWGVSPDTHMIIDTNVGPLTAIDGGANAACIRHFDPSTEILTVRGEVFELRPVIAALENLEKTLATLRADTARGFTC